MKFTATAKFNALAAGGAKTATWNVYVRKVTDISEALDAGTAWTDVTNRIDAESMPDIVNRIEYEVGQFVIDSLELTGIGLEWWRDNVFNAGASEYIELKVTFALSGASDSANIYSGFIDKVNVDYDEFEDTASFTAYSSTDLAARLAAENVSTQYIEPDSHGDSSNVQGLIMDGIRGVYVVDAAISSYELRPGEHTLTLQWDNITPQMKLDDGAWVNVANGNNTLGDAEDSADDIERIQIYIRDTTDLPSGPTGEWVDYVVVVTQGTTLPNQWYSHTSIKRIITEIYDEIGIGTLNTQVLEIDTHDSRTAVSFIEAPPLDPGIAGSDYVLEADGTDLFVAYNNKIYRRDASTEQFTLLTTLSSGEVIKRMIYHYRASDHEDLWIYHLNGTNVKVSCYEIDTATLRTSVTLTTSGTSSVPPNGIAVVDYNYTGASYKYSLPFVVAVTGSDNGYFKEVTKSGGSALSIATIFTDIIDPASLGYGISGHFLFIKSGNSARYTIVVDGSPDSSGFEEAYVDTSGNWVDNGTIFLNASYDNSEVVAYGSTDDLVYFYDSGNLQLKSHDAESFGTVYTHVTLDSSGEDIGAVYAYGGKVYFSTYHYAGESEDTREDYRIWTATGTGSAAIADYWAYAPSQLVWANSRIYGMDVNAILFQFHSDVALYVSKARFNEMSVLDALTKMINGFGLVSTIGANKEAYLYLRGNGSGTPQTTGETLIINESNSSGISQVLNYFPGVDLVKVRGETTETSYNGTAFDSSVLSDKRTLDVESPFIPDLIIKDIAKWLYAFFSVDRNLYRIELGDAPYFQYEPFDNGGITFTATKIQKTGSGPIYTATYRAPASMEIEVLI